MLMLGIKHDPSPPSAIKAITLQFDAKEVKVIADAPCSNKTFESYNQLSTEMS